MSAEVPRAEMDRVMRLALCIANRERMYRGSLAFTGIIAAVGVVTALVTTHSNVALGAMLSMIFVNSTTTWWSAPRIHRVAEEDLHGR